MNRTGAGAVREAWFDGIWVWVEDGWKKLGTAKDQVIELLGSRVVDAVEINLLVRIC